jgi:hypothetical protein
MIPVFEYYFYPEYALKQVKHATPSKIEFMDIKDYEREVSEC